MNSHRSWISGALTGVLVLWGAAAGAQDFVALADRVAGAGGGTGISRYAVEEFAAAGGATPEEAAAAKSGFAQELNDRDGADVMDAMLLSGLARGKAWPQALVQGTLYGSGAGRELVIKLKDRSGRNLGIYQVSLPAGQSPPADLRDAPRGVTPCERQRRSLAMENRALVELKARYWAARVRSPEFSYADLAAAPGGELKEYPVIQRFYTLVNAYYEQDGPVRLAPGEAKKVEDLLKKESAYAAACAAR